MIKSGYALERVSDGVELLWWDAIPPRIDVPGELKVLFAAVPDWTDGVHRIVARDKEFDDPPPSRRIISKAAILDRLTDEQLAAAIGLMSQRQREKWRMPGSPGIYVDDPELLAVIAAIGADAEVVLAPDV